MNLTSLAQLDGDLQPQTLICQDCGAPFTFWVEEQNYFRRMQYPPPIRLPPLPRAKEAGAQGVGGRKALAAPERL